MEACLRDTYPNADPYSNHDPDPIPGCVVCRHVYETPTFFLNGFEVPEPFKANTGTANITGWTTVIDPLLETPPMADEL